MTLSRSVRSGLALLLLALAGLGLYVYQNLPDLVKQHAETFMLGYGVEGIDFETPHFSGTRFTLDKARVHGTFEGYTYSATLDTLEVRYDWRALIDQQIQSVTVSRLAISVSKTASGSTPESSDFDAQRLLLQQPLTQLPVHAVHIDQWQLDYQPDSGTLRSASGTLHLEEMLDLRISSAIAGAEITALVRAGDGPPGMTASIKVNDDDADIISIATQLQRADEDTLEWKVQGNWEHTDLLTWLQRLSKETIVSTQITTPKEFTVAGNGEFTADIRHPNILQLPLALDSSALLEFSASVRIASRLEQLDYPGVVEQMSGSLICTLELQDGQLQVAVAPFELSGSLSSKQLSLPPDTLRSLGWGDTVPARWHSPLGLGFNYSEKHSWSSKLHDTLLQLGDTRTQLRLESVQLDIGAARDEPLRLTTELTASIKTRLHEQQLPQFELGLRQQGTIDQSRFDITLRDTAESMAIELIGTVNLANGGGKYTLTAQSQDLPYLAGSAIPHLQHFGILRSEMQILNGNLKIDSTLKSTDWGSDSWTQKTHLVLEELGGSYAEYRFDNLALDASWTGIERVKSLQPVTLSIDKLDVGFEIGNILARANLPKFTAIEKPSIEIEELRMEMFRGQLHLKESTAWDFGAGENKLTLNAQQWQLADLVALQRDEDIQAQGILAGEMPVTMAHGRIIIEKGYLKALPPGGSIRYVPNESSRALGDTSKELQLALDLLSDFQYKVLSSSVDLDKEGNLTLGMSLAGHNPAHFDGRAINLNVNLEQNLDPLLQSLRVSGKLTEKIENRLK